MGWVRGAMLGTSRRGEGIGHKTRVGKGRGFIARPMSMPWSGLERVIYVSRWRGPAVLFKNLEVLFTPCFMFISKRQLGLEKWTITVVCPEF